MTNNQPTPEERLDKLWCKCPRGKPCVDTRVSIIKELAKAKREVAEEIIDLIKKEIEAENKSGAYNRNYHRVRMCEEIIELINNHD